MRRNKFDTQTFPVLLTSPLAEICISSCISVGVKNYKVPNGETLNGIFYMTRDENKINDPIRM